MDAVNKTLYIPLYGKAWVSRRGLLLHDPKAEEIWDAQGFPLKGKSASKWLAYSMGMRSAVFDHWLAGALRQWPDALVLHLGCGLDSRCGRVSCENAWFDVDFPQVIAERESYFAETDRYHMIPSDIRAEAWLSRLPGGRAIVVMEGVSMYLSAGERLALLKNLTAHFEQVRLLMDVYTVFGARASKYKNPVNDVGVRSVHGLDDPRELEQGTGLLFLREHDMAPEEMIRQLPGSRQAIFRTLFAGETAKKFYRLYEYADR